MENIDHGEKEKDPNENDFREMPNYFNENNGGVKLDPGVEEHMSLRTATTLKRLASGSETAINMALSKKVTRRIPRHRQYEVNMQAANHPRGRSHP